MACYFSPSPSGLIAARKAGSSADLGPELFWQGGSKSLVVTTRELCVRVAMLDGAHLLDYIRRGQRGHPSSSFEVQTTQQTRNQPGSIRIPRTCLLYTS